jgi:phosphatidylglycerol:prolipoprotein diacylglycerol transferase
MRPFLFHIGSLGVPSFFIMIMVGALSATFFGAWLARREGADPVAILDCGIIAIIAAVLGSRIFHILVEAPGYYWENPIRIFYFWQGGFVSIGAYIFSISGCLIYMWKRGLSGWRYLDLLAAIVPIVIFFTRIGCLCVGCCYGKPTDFFIHLTFHNPESTAALHYLNVPLHATQIYNMLNALVMWGVLLLVYRYRKSYGQVAAAFLIYYGITRFLIEFLRGDVDRGMWFGGAVSTGQIAMLFAFVIGVIILLVRHRHPIEGSG